MIDDEFLKFLFPPVLTFKREVVINLIMFAITVLVAWLFNDPSSPVYSGTFQ